MVKGCEGEDKMNTEYNDCTAAERGLDDAMHAPNLHSEIRTTEHSMRNYLCLTLPCPSSTAISTH